MLEYFAYKKFKQHKDKKEKGKQALINQPAIDEQDELFLESTLLSDDPPPASSNMRKRFSFFSDRMPSIKKQKSNTQTSDAGPSAQNNTEQKNEIDEALKAFDMKVEEKSFTQKLHERIGVYTVSTQTRELLHEFVQILKDTQNGVPLAGQDLIKFFEKHTQSLKEANDSVPSFIKALVLKLLPISTVPSIADLAKPGALMSLIKSVLQVLKTRFPAFVGTSVLMVLAVLVVMLGLFYAFKRGREEREASENPAAATVEEHLTIDPNRVIATTDDGSKQAFTTDEDGMRVPA